MKSLTSCFIIFLIFTGCQPEKKQEETSMKKDQHSFSQPDKARVTHLNWKAKVDFEKKVIEAVATWKFEAASDAEEIVFDTKGLTINKITLNDDEVVEQKLGAEDGILGNALTVPLKPGTKTISIFYKTDPEAEALQWLSPQQTASKGSPFLFTQSQAILARSWVPCQDSPSIRFTYEAEVTVPGGLLALMSASNPKEKNTTGVYQFNMKQPIPSYLLALAVGDIKFHEISPRSG
ncbi:MAG TPA: aminopeptidase, partial [Chryseolinea sp.]